MLSLALSKEKNQYGDIDCVYLDLTSPEQKLKDGFFMNDLSIKFKLDYADKNIVDIYPIMRDLRMVKSSEEIECLIKAIEKTNNGIAFIVNKLMVNGHVNVHIVQNNQRVHVPPYHH